MLGCLNTTQMQQVRTKKKNICWMKSLMLKKMLIFGMFYYFVRLPEIQSVKQQIYSIDVYTDNYLSFFFKDLFRLLLNYFLLLGYVNISDTIGGFSMTQ